MVKKSKVKKENDPKKALNLLKRQLPGRVFLDKNSRFKASIDNLRLSFLPDVVIKVQSEDDVGNVLKLAHQFRIPVTSRGAGSSPTGSAIPLHGGWALDLSALKTMEIDVISRMATVGAGVITAELQEKVEALDLFYPIDPSSRKFSTIGGNIACNAGGMRCLKYGVTRDYVLALRGFLANGSYVRWGLPLKKYVSGLNLRDLWIGSEGTLGVVTGATLKLIPKPEKRWTGMFAFQNEKNALSMVIDVHKAGIAPSILEFLDRQSVECAEKYNNSTVFKGISRPSILLIELDGCSFEVREEKRALLKLMEGRALEQKEARSENQAEKFWQMRRTCSQSMFQIADTKINEDVVVPLKKQIDLIKYTITLKKEIGLATPTFGHAGDGNLHVHIMYNRKNKQDTKKAKIGIERLMKKVVELGGAITGEHGIGLAKSPFMKMQHSTAEIAAMQSIKQTLDPRGILNPGKIFHHFEVWDHEKVDVTLPWDH